VKLWGITIAVYLYLIYKCCIVLWQDVPETIATLREANMKVWVLTGDKLETAVNIGYASKQLVGGMDIMTISDQATITDVQRKVSEFCGRMDRGTTERHAALVIDGKSLSFALDSTVEKDFLNLALSCKSVICCRVSPLQKAEVVTLVRTNVKDSITLAIGDGANDVSMIQAAHIGVGISGREGLQATLASDYAISQFRFLAKLLLVHGAWNYRRLANVILYSFYKNICLYMIEFWFAFLNGFSGQPLFERWTIGLYNILFTLLAPIALGILDQDVSASTRLAQPHLYKTSQQNSAFNTKVGMMGKVSFVFIPRNGGVHSALSLLCSLYQWCTCAVTIVQDAVTDSSVISANLIKKLFVSEKMTRFSSPVVVSAMEANCT
jgi:phospholipid-transporting ATPase